MPLYMLRIDTYEAKPYPVVSHLFYGATPEECVRYRDAHYKSDRFLSECGSTGQFEGRLRCRNVEHPIVVYETDLAALSVAASLR